MGLSSLFRVFPDLLGIHLSRLSPNELLNEKFLQLDLFDNISMEIPGYLCD